MCFTCGVSGGTRLRGTKNVERLKRSMKTLLKMSMKTLKNTLDIIDQYTASSTDSTL